MKSPDRFLFEGEMRTLTEIRAMVPALSSFSIRKRLSDGLNTRVAMLSYDARAAMRNPATLAQKRDMSRLFKKRGAA